MKQHWTGCSLRTRNVFEQNRSKIYSPLNNASFGTFANIWSTIRAALHSDLKA